MKPKSFRFQVNLGYNLTVYSGKKDLKRTKVDFNWEIEPPVQETGRFVPYLGDSWIIR